MIGKAVEKGSNLPFPKLMENNYVVAILNDKDSGIVVHRLSDAAVSVGTKIECLGQSEWKDYNGYIQISNS